MKHPKAYLKKAPREFDNIDEQDAIMKVAGILHRRRRLVMFPVSLTDAYWKLFPAMIQGVLQTDMAKGGATATKKEQGDYFRAMNLRRSMRENRIIPVEFIGKPERAFYMKMKSDLYAPDGRAASTLVVPPDYPYYVQVYGWLEAAVNMDARHDMLTNAIAQFLRACKDVHTLRTAWPAMADVLKLTGPFHPVAPTTVAHLDHVLPRAQRQHIVEQLAAALMLDPYEPDAWNGYGPMGGD